MSTLKVDTLTTRDGQSSLTLGASGKTLTIPSGATISNSGTATGFGGTNTPQFHAYLSSSQTLSNSVLTKISIDTEVFDSDNDFTSNKWTPSAGTYFVYGQVRLQRNGVTDQIGCYIRKNGADLFTRFAYGNYYTASNVFGTVSMNGTDYLELWGVHQAGSNTDISPNSDKTFFGGYKIIT